MATTKNLGIVKAIHVGTTAPTNTKILWFDDNTGVKIIKAFDTVLNDWVAVKDQSSGIYSAVTGTNNYTGNTTPSFSSYIEGFTVFVKISATNTGAVTFAFNSLAAKSAKKEGTKALESGDLEGGRIYAFTYDGTNFQLINNPIDALLELKGNLDASSNPNYPSASKGDSYVITGAGKVGGGSGQDVEVGDYLVAKNDNAGGTEAAVGSDWFIVQNNISQATETSVGYAEIATQSETDAGTDDERIITPEKLNNTPLAVSADGSTKVKIKIIEIGDWDMNSVEVNTVAHGLSDRKKIKSASASIRNDADTAISNLIPLFADGGGGTDNGGCVAGWDDTNIALHRFGSGFFDNASYDSTSFNRGWITIIYEV